MADCSFARCQQERRAIKKELQRWTKNMVYILGLERVAEELMGRRKWKLYQDGLLPRRNDSERSSEDESMPATDGPPPALKIKTIEQINAPDDVRPKLEQEQNTVAEDVKPARAETILETLIRKPATQPKLEYAEEPTDWKPADKCYFCVDGDPGAEPRPAGGATSPASESDSSSVSGARSPAAAPQLLHHLLQMQSPQALAQFQQMMAALAALGSGLVPPALSQAWLMQRLAQSRQQAERLPSESSDKVPLPDSSPSMSSEQPLDLSAKSSSTGGSPPPISKNHDNSRANNLSVEGPSAGSRRAYTEDELKSALRDIQSGKLGTRRASVVYGIPRSTLRNKVYKLSAEPGPDSEPDSDPERPDSPPSVILKIPTFPVPDDNKSSSPGAGPLPGAFAASLSAPPRPPLLLPPSVFADPPPSQQIFTSLSDVIAKSISQKFQQHPQAGAEHPFIRAPDRHVSVIKTPPEGPRPFPAPSNSRTNNNNNGQQPPGGKGTRPKRGKYRNYDRDSLVEAVKAVQRGEMSVHRAGSYYGVPHSTLEYKVKERHLMRPRKREPKPQPQDNGKPQPPKPPPPKPPAKPFSNGLNGPEAGYPGGYFWPPSAFPPPPAPELYASHMMRRLREEAPPANGSFLEGIIRSSLERPSAALLQRLTAPADEPPSRRPRLHSADRHLADEMRETVQRLREGRARNGDASPEPPPPPPPDRP